ncbi:MAG: hypothetical protein ACYS7Y_16020 [Planctomycetota bacterium]|jgi:hypothetical protein
MDKDPKTYFRRIGKYSGPVIHGESDVFDQKHPTLKERHLVRAFWLTTMVESGGKLGSIMMADGTGVTAGLEQVVAVYPNNMKQQGPLFKLLNRIDNITPVAYFLDFDQYKWRITEDGVLRDKHGEAVSPKVIRDTFTPPDGKVPKSGHQWEEAKEWALDFHALFRMKQTKNTQFKCGIEHLAKFAKRYRSKLLGYETVENICYDGEVHDTAAVSLFPEMDLAMCMFWNYKTNAPSPALKALNKARITHSPTNQPVKFAHHLLKEMRESDYGRWGTNRYDRSREYAMLVWPQELFEGPDAIMPARQAP